MTGGPVFLPRRGLSAFAERMLAEPSPAERASLDEVVEHILETRLDARPRTATAG